MHARAEKIRKSKIAARPPKTFLNLFVDKCRRRPPPGEGAVRARARALNTQKFLFDISSSAFIIFAWPILKPNVEFSKLKKIKKNWKIPPNFPLRPPPCLFVLSYGWRRSSLLMLILTLTMGGSFWEDFFLDALQPNWSVKNYSKLSKLIRNYLKSSTFYEINTLKIFKIFNFW